MTRACLGSIGLCALLCIALGCKSKSVCELGHAECVSTSVLRSCVPGGDHNSWFLYQCPAGETCGAPSGGGGGGSGDAGAGSGVEGACNGECAAGNSECIDDRVARVCVDGRSWQLQPCQAGQRCVDGACVFSDGGIQVCAPQSRACGSDKMEKVCDRDGSKWIEQPCEMGEKCLVDRCAPDPDASCDVPSRCLDNKTALRCLGEGKGFAVVACDNDTYCEGGQCRGPLCALGSVCGSDNQVIECVAGTSLKVTQCGVNEACKAERDQASCVPKPCTPGEIKCGDPRDPKVDAKTHYTQCKPGTQTASGLPEWALGECTGLLTCDPARAAMGSPCHQDCTPGEQTCTQNLQLSIADGWAECQDDGTWGPTQSCNQDGELRQQCAIKPDFDASALPVAICVDPVCAYVITNQDAVGGSCSGGQIQACDSDGKLQAAAPCDVGICRATGTQAQSDGRVPGACDTDVTCKDGEQRCLVDSLVPTTLYQTCENGIWSAKLTTCDSDGQCLDYVDAMGLHKAICGADCAPGEKRCDVSDQVQSCGSDGKWGTAKSCPVGTCSTIGATPGKRDAACVLECVPDEKRCTGTQVTAPDGVSTGFSQQATCGSDGLLGTPEDCPTDTVCRVSGAGEHLGCVQCVGPNVLGGNTWGYQDTRCDPSAAAKVQQCADDNTWDSSRSCSGGKSCRMVNGTSCGTCYVGGSYVTCSEAAIAAQQRCGPCTVPSYGTITACYDSYIASVTASTTPQTCMSLFGDGPAVAASGQAAGTTSWGNYSDCCDGKSATGTDGEFLQYQDCQALGYGTPMAAGGVSDCCSSYVTAASGAAFAYCATP